MSVSQSQFPPCMSFSATSAAVLAPSIPDDDVYTFDQLSPDQVPNSSVDMNVSILFAF